MGYPLTYTPAGGSSAFLFALAPEETLNFAPRNPIRVLGGTWQLRQKRAVQATDVMMTRTFLLRGRAALVLVRNSRRFTLLGRMNAYWVPSGKNDYRLYQSGSATDTEIWVHTDSVPQELRDVNRHIVFQDFTANQAMKIDSYEVDTGNPARTKLTVSVGLDDDITTATRIENLYLVRDASDSDLYGNVSGAPDIYTKRIPMIELQGETV